MRPKIGNYVLCINGGWQCEIGMIYRVTSHKPGFVNLITVDGGTLGTSYKRFIDLGTSKSLTKLEKAIYGIT